MTPDPTQWTECREFHATAVLRQVQRGTRYTAVIARKTGLGRETVRRHLHDLVALHCVVRHSHDRWIPGPLRQIPGL